MRPHGDTALLCRCVLEYTSVTRFVQDVGEDVVRKPPNGLAFSCRKRAAQDHLSKSNDLAREAVNCNARLCENRAEHGRRQINMVA